MESFYADEINPKLTSYEDHRSEIKKYSDKLAGIQKQLVDLEFENIRLTGAYKDTESVLIRLKNELYDLAKK